MRPCPQFSVSGRVNRPHFEQSVTMLRALEPRLGIGKAAPHLVGIAVGGPAFRDPFVGVLLRDDVHHLGAANVIGDEMAAGPDPLDVPVGLQHIGRHVAALQQRAPHHLAGISGIVVAIERAADDRPDAVGADHEIRIECRPVGEAEHDGSPRSSIDARRWPRWIEAGSRLPASASKRSAR